MQIKQNTKSFKIISSAQFIQIQSTLSTFTTQILINKRTIQIILEKKQKAFEFDTQAKSKFVSLIIGIIVVEGNYFLVYAEEVYPAPKFIDKYKVYQLACVDFIPFAPEVTKTQEMILESIQKSIFKFGFYYSLQTDFTSNLQNKIYNKSFEHYDRFFWNQSMLNLMLQKSQNREWHIPIIQGHYNYFQTILSGNNIKYYLISRRSKYRSGARYFSRGINDNGNCANFIETQQVVMVNNKVHSTVFVSGSTPVFWQQKFVTAPIRLTRRKQLTKQAFIKHMNNLSNLYGRIFCVNLMEQKKQDQNLLIQAYEQIFQESQQQINSFAKYAYFDINSQIKAKTSKRIIDFLDKLQPICNVFGFYGGQGHIQKIFTKQNGVFRISCLDCLARTNEFMRLIAFICFKNILRICSIPMQDKTIEQNFFCKIEQTPKPFIKTFRNIWNQKSDFESTILAGSQSKNNLKNNILEQASNYLVSISRLYNQVFKDKMKQKAYNAILHQQSKLDTVNSLKHKMKMSVGIITWNVANEDPQKLNLQQLVDLSKNCDLVVVGLQEIVDLSVTQNLIQGQESKMAGKWIKQLTKVLQKSADRYLMVDSTDLVGLFLIVMISQKWKNCLKGSYKDAVKTGLGGTAGNKGGITIRIKIFQTSICFTCVHLAAHLQKNKERIADFLTIHQKTFQQDKISIKNQQSIEQSNYRFFFGDLNFRIEGDFKKIYKSLQGSLTQGEKQKILQQLLPGDQLNMQRFDVNCPVTLADYSEKNIQFLPTYKLSKQTGQFSTTKNRNPSWTDRILYNSDEELYTCNCIYYHSLQVTGSDHKPVFGRFVIEILRQQRKKSDCIYTPHGKQFRDSYLDSLDT